MTRGLNKVMIIGRLGRDPEMRYTPNGRPVTAFSVAVNRSWTAGDGDNAKRRNGSTSSRGAIWPRFASSICAKARPSTSKAGCKRAVGKIQMARSTIAPRLSPTK